MQTHGGQAAVDAITGRERSFKTRLLVDWNDNGQYDHPLSDLTDYASNVSLDRTMQGSVPEEITLIEGAAAAELQATLSGTYQDMPLTAVFSQYQLNSPFYVTELVGYEVKYSIDVITADGVVNYPQFIGNVRNVDPVREEGTVELVALDRVEKLRAPVNFPKWAISRYWLERGRKRAQLTDSQWLIDHCLRQCNTSVTGFVPAPEYADEDFINMTRFFISGTGSTAPSVGNYDNFGAQDFPDTEGGAGEMYTTSGAKPDSVDGPLPLCFNDFTTDYNSRYWSDNPAAESADLTHYVTLNLVTRNGTQNLTNGAPIIRIHMPDAHQLEMYCSDGQMRGRWYDDRSNVSYYSSWYVLPTDADAQDSIHVVFGTEWSNENGLQMFFDFNGANTGWENLDPSGPPGTGSYYALTGLIEVARVVEFNDLMYQKNNWFDAALDAFTVERKADYFAALDSGRNRLTFIPERDGEDAWDIIKEVAAAEFGAVFWDEDGVFRFWNYDTVNAKRGTIVRTLTADEVEGLSLTNSIDSVRNTFSVELKHKQGVYGTVYESSDPDVVYFGGHERKLTQFPRNACTFPNPFPLVQHDTLGDEGSGFPQWSDATLHAYVPQWFMDDPDTTSSELVWREDQFRDAEGGNQFLYINRDGYIELSYANGWDEAMRFATDPTSSGGQHKGAIRVAGSYVEDQSNTVYQTKDQASVDKYGVRNLKLSGDWYQDRFQTENMLAIVLERTAQPVPVTDNITIPGDPRIQLADTIEISDPQGFGESLKCQIFGIKHTVDPEEGFTTELAVELVRPAGKWILGHPRYSVLGETTVL